MPDAFEQQDWVRTGVAAAMLRSLDADSETALKATADLLTSALPNRVKTEYKGLFTKKLVKVSVELGEDLLTMELDRNGSLVGTRVHMSRGIALKKEEWPLEKWVEAMVTKLEEKAQNDDRARDALKRWLGEVG